MDGVEKKNFSFNIYKNGKIEQAIEYLENEQAIEGSAATDCPSGICELPVSVTE